MRETEIILEVPEMRKAEEEFLNGQTEIQVDKEDMAMEGPLRATGPIVTMDLEEIITTEKVREPLIDLIMMGEPDIRATEPHHQETEIDHGAKEMVSMILLGGFTMTLVAPSKMLRIKE